VDDTVAKSKKKQDHINDLARVLIRLVANRITIKMKNMLVRALCAARPGDDSAVGEVSCQ